MTEFSEFLEFGHQKSLDKNLSALCFSELITEKRAELIGKRQDQGVGKGVRKMKETN